MDFSDVDLLDGIDPPSPEDESRQALISSVLHEQLRDFGITTKYKPRTAYRHAVKNGSIANNVVTSYVEHAFISWLLLSKHKIAIPAIPDTSPCQSGDVDPEIFFESADPADFLEGDFDSEGDEELSLEEMTRILEERIKNESIPKARAAKYIKARQQDALNEQAAKAACGDCQFSLECLTTSIVQVDKQGIWGGLNSEARYLMINRFESMRRSYENGNMDKKMRKDFETKARQIALTITSDVGLKLVPAAPATVF